MTDTSALEGGGVVDLVAELVSVSARAVAAERALDGVFDVVEARIPDSRDALEHVAKRIADAENRAALFEFRYRRLRGRRALRVSAALGKSVWPREWLRLPGRLRSALKRHSLPVEPVLVDAGSVVGELAPVGGVLHRGFRLDYPYLRIGHWGPVASFGSMAPHRSIGSVDEVDSLVDEGADLLIIEPVAGRVPPGFISGAVERVIDAGIPVVLFVRTVTDLDLKVARSCSTILTDDVDVARVARERFGDRVLSVAPFVDDTIYNPAGWQRSPKHASAAVFVPATWSLTHHPVLAGLISSQAEVYHLGEEPVGNANEFVSVAKGHVAAIVDPTQFVSEASFLEQVVRLAASGTPVITAETPHLDIVFPGDDLIAVVKTADQATEAFDMLSADSLERERRSIRTRQFVLQNHTTRHRFDQLLTHHAIPIERKQKISILFVTKRPDFLEHAIKQIRAQNYPVKELVTVLHGTDFDLDEFAALTEICDFPTITVQQPSTVTFGDCLNTAIDHATGDLVTKMDDDDYYGPNHLTDLVTALHYSQADIVGKRSNFVIFQRIEVAGLWNSEWTEVTSSHLPGATILMRSEVARQFRFGRLWHGVDSDLLQRTRAQGATTYSTHPFNFVRMRHEDHTFGRSDAAFLEKTIVLTKDIEPESVYA